MKYNEKGEELPNPVPVAPPIGYKKQPSMVEMIRNMVRSEQLRHAAEKSGHESFEDADDFDVGDDIDPKAPYEAEFEPTPVDELRRRASEAERTPPVGGAPPVVPPVPLEAPKASADAPKPLVAPSAPKATP